MTNMMTEKVFKISLVLVAVIFTVIFCILIIPLFIENPDIIRAFAAGFVNPYSSGYSTDVICCWVILLLWVIHESPKIRHGWICLLLGIVPGVAVGFALYLILKTNPIKNNSKLKE